MNKTKMEKEAESRTCRIPEQGRENKGDRLEWITPFQR
jgi:hypothetical protein